MNINIELLITKLENKANDYSRGGNFKDTVVNEAVSEALQKFAELLQECIVEDEDSDYSDE